MIKKVKLNDTLEISKIVHGHWRLADWALSANELQVLINQVLDLGITTFDHADIYGNYSCEALFGRILERDPSLRNRIELVTKCGIKLISDKYPERQLNHYDNSYKHIIASVENSLNNFNTDRIDVLLLHRPSPFFQPQEVAKAFDDLKRAGKVLHFGVSNYLPSQIEMLKSYLDYPLVTNQIEFSPYCLEHFDHGTVDYLLQHRITPMAWSPLAGGKLLKPTDEKGRRIMVVLNELADQLGVNDLDMVIYAWILKHPLNAIPILGTGKIERIKRAVEAMNIEMTLEQWFKLYVASRGENVP